MTVALTKNDEFDRMPLPQRHSHRSARGRFGGAQGRPVDPFPFEAAEAAPDQFPLTGPSVQITAAKVDANGLVTATSQTAHGFSNSLPVAVFGIAPAGYSGVVSVAPTNENTFTYKAQAGLGAPTLSNASAAPLTQIFPMVWDAEGFGRTQLDGPFGESLPESTSATRRPYYSTKISRTIPERSITGFPPVQ